MIKTLNEYLRDWLHYRHIKAFPVTIADRNIRHGVQSLIQAAGLGKLKPNILLMGYKSEWSKLSPTSPQEMQKINQYFGLIQFFFFFNF